MYSEIMTREFLGRSTSASSVTYSNLSVNVGDLLVILTSNFDFEVLNSFSVSSTNMGTITWTEITQTRNNDGTKQTRGSIIYGVVASTTTTGTLTIDCARGYVFSEVHKFIDHNGVGGKGTVSSDVGDGGTISLTLDAAPASSDVTIAHVLHHTYNSSASLVPGTGYVEIFEFLADQRDGQTQYRENSTSTACTWALTSSGAQGEVGVAIVVKAAENFANFFFFL